MTLENALFYGAITAIPLIAGAIITKFVIFSGKILGTIMAFGSGSLIVAITFSLMSESYTNGGIVITAVGFFTGAIIFSVGNFFISKKGGKHRKRFKHPENTTDENTSTGSAIALGSLIDNIPESLALGVSAISGIASIAFLVGIIVSNFPESVAGSQSMKHVEKSTKSIIIVWTTIGLVNIVSTALGFLVLSKLGPEAIAFSLALAAGAMLAMLSETMIPEAYRNGGFFISIATASGFMVSLVLTLG